MIMSRKYLPLALLACCMFLLCGCAVGRGAMGEVVVGLDVGKLTENVNQAVGQAIDSLLPGFGTLAAVVFPPIGALAIGWARSHAAARAATARKEGEDHGWESREKAAGTQQPLARVPDGGAAAPVVSAVDSPGAVS